MTGKKLLNGFLTNIKLKNLNNTSFVVKIVSKSLFTKKQKIDVFIIEEDSKHLKKINDFVCLTLSLSQDKNNHVVIKDDISTIIKTMNEHIGKNFKYQVI